MPAAGTIATLWSELLGKPAGLRLASTDEIVELLQNADVAAIAARAHVAAVVAEQQSLARMAREAVQAASEALRKSGGSVRMATEILLGGGS